MSPREEGAGPWDRLTGLHLGPQAHTQPWKRAPGERLPSALSSASPPRESPGPWGPLTEQAGRGVPPDQGSPCPSHLTKAEQGGEHGGHGVSSCGPGCEDGGDLGVLRTDRPQGVSSPGLGLPVTWLSHQCPHRKGNSLFLKARHCSCDSPSVFLRHPFEVWASRACPSL